MNSSNVLVIKKDDFPELFEQLSAMADGETCDVLVTVSRDSIDDDLAETTIVKAVPQGGYKEEGGDEGETDKVIEWAKKPEVSMV